MAKQECRFTSPCCAINVGGRSLPMVELRAMLTERGHDNPRTLLQSGNAVLTVKAKVSAATLEAKFEAEARLPARAYRQT
jgi:uncharacterized protein (DUF1697 family)